MRSAPCSGALTLAVADYLLGNVLERVLGDLATVKKPLLIGLVILTAVWIAHRHIRNHSSTAAARAKPGPRG